MENYEHRIFALLESYELGQATDIEVKELEAWYETFQDRPDILSSLSDPEKVRAREKMLNSISTQLPNHIKTVAVPKKASAVLWQRWVVAASLFIILSSGGYFLLTKNRSEASYSKVLKQDFPPGANKAVLTLAGGKKILLTGAKEGQLAIQGGTIVKKTADGKVVYGSNGTDIEAVMNTISTPRGGQYHLTLTDGTGVWLNAASSITYPSSFTGSFRQVQITGEVYFEVAHNVAKPFFVKSGDQLVEVLGTHFNINAYADERNITTTLLQGSVAVSSGGEHQILKPGQQSTLSNKSLKITEADTDEAVAWKDGFFQFVDADIETIMRQISRWYDVEVVFEGPITKQTFTGRISRFRNISKTLKIVQSYKDVALSFDGRRIMVQ